MPKYIVSVNAEDRVGIVHNVTGTLRDLGGNVLELSQTVMRDYFTIILAVEFRGPRDPAELREEVARRGARFGLTVAVIDADGVAAAPPAAHGERFILTVLGDDHPGNVHGIAGCLADRGVNINDLHAIADGPRFRLVMEVFLPPDLSPAALRDDLQRFGRPLGLEAYVQHENIFRSTNEPRPVEVGPAPNPRGAAAIVPH